MSFVDWLLTSEHVQREVNIAYFIGVCAIAFTTLAYAIRTKNKPAINMFIFSIPIWGFIEGLGLVMGWRAYHGLYPPLTYVLVAFVEDPGWVCLAYIVAEALFEKFWPAKGMQASIEPSKGSTSDENNGNNKEKEDAKEKNTTYGNEKKEVKKEN